MKREEFSNFKIVLLKAREFSKYKTTVNTGKINVFMFIYKIEVL